MTSARKIIRYLNNIKINDDKFNIIYTKFKKTMNKINTMYYTECILHNNYKNTCIPNINLAAITITKKIDAKLDLFEKLINTQAFRRGYASLNDVKLTKYLDILYDKDYSKILFVL